MEYYPSAQRQQTTIKFSANSSLFQRVLEVNNIVQHSSFENNANPNGSFAKVYDISGKLISETEIEPNKNNHIINTSSLSNGIYILNIVDRKGTFNQSVKIAK